MGGFEFGWGDVGVVVGDLAVEAAVVAGPVGLRTAARFGLFRYEVRRWRDGLVPDLRFAEASPIRITYDARVAENIHAVLPSVPRLTWGRDERGVGEMWSCNSIISWCLATAGAEVERIALPPNGRAPDWAAGIAVAQQAQTRISVMWQSPMVTSATH